MQQDEPPGRGAGPEEQNRESRRERRRRRRRARRDERPDTTDTVCETCELVDSVPECGAPGCRRLGGGRSGGGSGDGCACDGPCDLSLLRLSTLPFVAAAVMPACGAGGLVRALLRGYQRWLTHYTPACPSTPNCRAYALAAVEASGARAGLRAAAKRAGSPP